MAISLRKTVDDAIAVVSLLMSCLPRSKCVPTHPHPLQLERLRLASLELDYGVRL